MMAIRDLTALVLISSALLSACGQKGELFLPSSDAAPAAVESAPAEESDESTDDEGENETSGE